MEQERTKKLDLVTRVEVIDEKGRSYVNWDSQNEVSISVQDDGRTLKVFVKKDIEKEKEPTLDMTPYQKILKEASTIIHDQDYPPELFADFGKRGE
jgi:hypothetical protein